MAPPMMARVTQKVRQAPQVLEELLSLDHSVPQEGGAGHGLQQELAPTPYHVLQSSPRRGAVRERNACATSSLLHQLEHLIEHLLVPEHLLRQLALVFERLHIGGMFGKPLH
jgi:hypothetical protein